MASKGSPVFPVPEDLQLVASLLLGHLVGFDGCVKLGLGMSKADLASCRVELFSIRRFA
jgi:hypothetical protein